MKSILTLSIILSLVITPFTPFSQNARTNTSIASVEYLDKQVPVEKKAKQKKRKQKHLKYKFKKKKKQQTNQNKKALSTFFIVMASFLFLAFLAWVIFFLPILLSGSAFAPGCIGASGLLFFGILGIFFSGILLAGAIILLFFAIRLINRRKGKIPLKVRPAKEKKPEEVDYIRVQIQDKASKELPNFDPETLEKYVNIKKSMVDLKYYRSKLEARKPNDPMKARIQMEIDNIDNKLTSKESLIASIENIHADLEDIPDSKRLPYTNIKIKLAELQLEQKKYQQQNDLRSRSRLRGTEDAIQTQKEALKLLLGIRKN